jgi:hypothetical protein
MHLTEIYVDLNGDTHFRDVSIALAPRDFAPPSAPMGVSAELALTTGVFIELPAGWDPRYHASPRRQLVIVLKGALHITATDGATRDFGPGGIFLLHDEHGKGHQTLVKGQEKVELFLVGTS